MGTRAVTTRRSFLAVAGLGAAAVAVDAATGHRPQRTVVRLVRAASGPGAQPQAATRPGARPAAVRLVTAPATVDLGGRTVRTWAFNGELPGPELRLRAG